MLEPRIDARRYEEPADVAYSLAISTKRIADALERIAANMEPLIVDTANDGMVRTIMDLAIQRRDGPKPGHLP